MASFSYNILSNIDLIYDEAELEVKQQMISSIYPFKLIYEKNQYRTPKKNEVLELIELNFKGLRGNKKGTDDISINQSHQVIPLVELSNSFIEDLKLLYKLKFII